MRQELLRQGRESLQTKNEPLIYMGINQGPFLRDNRKRRSRPVSFFPSSSIAFLPTKINTIIEKETTYFDPIVFVAKLNTSKDLSAIVRSKATEL